jgi:hypothetical protein
MYAVVVMQLLELKEKFLSRAVVERTITGHPFVVIESMGIFVNTENTEDFLGQTFAPVTAIVIPFPRVVIKVSIMRIVSALITSIFKASLGAIRINKELTDSVLDSQRV